MPATADVIFHSPRRAASFAALSLMMLAGCAAWNVRTADRSPADFRSRRPPAVATVSLTELPDYESRQAALADEARLHERLEREPGDAAAWLELSRNALAQGRWSAAERAGARSLALADDDRARVAIARARAGRGDRIGAVKAIEPVVRRNPADDRAAALLGHWYLGAGRSDEAVRLLRQRWEAEPPGVACGLELARLERDRDRLPEAADLFAACLAREPGDHVARRELAETLTALDRRSEARRQWDRLERAGEGGARAGYELARLDWLDARFAEAEDRFAAAVRLDPRHPKRGEVEALLTGTPLARRRDDYPALAR